MAFGSKKGLRVSLLASCVCLGLSGTAHAQGSADSVRFKIPAEDLGTTLNQIAQKTHREIVFNADLTRGKRARAISGELTAQQAVQQALAGSGLHLRVATSGQLVVESSPVSEREIGDGSGQASGDIVVTAQRKTEFLIDTPQSVSVLTEGSLLKSGAVQFRDWANAVPGLSFTTAGAGFTQVSMRGITTGFDVGPTTATYVDDVPYGSSTNFALGAQLGLDPGLFGLNRIEVLRGPQGTLYGASAMGGLIKYVTKAPVASALSGDAQAGISGTSHGGTNYNASASINLPIVSDRVAIRATAFQAHDGGYIDNVYLHQADVNRSNTYGARGDLLLKPTDRLSIRLNAFFQNIRRNGDGTADFLSNGTLAYGDLEQSRRVPEPFKQRFRVYSGTIAYDFGFATLSSISAYQTINTNLKLDVSGIYVPLLAAVLGRNYSAVNLGLLADTKKFTQELRLNSASGGALEWIIGGFYTHERSLEFETFGPFNPNGSPAVNDLLTYDNPSLYKEYAAYGDVTWHVARAFDITGGLRYANNNQTTAQVGSGLFVSPQPRTTSHEGVVTYLADARYHVSKDAMVYFRYSTGYRPGGPNYSLISPTTGLRIGPAAFKSDTLQNYEVGFKGQTPDRRYSIEVAAYLINWSNIQLSVSSSGFNFITNAPGGARVKGVELSASARPVDGLSLSATIGYTDARIKQANADLGAYAGERLPNTPRFTFTGNADYVLQSSGVRPTIGATFRYISDRFASFDQSTGYPQFHFPSYALFDLRASVIIAASSTSPITAQVFVHNLADRRGEQSILAPQFGNRVAIVQPRTIGLNLSVRY